MSRRRPAGHMRHDYTRQMGLHAARSGRAPSCCSASSVTLARTCLARHLRQHQCETFTPGVRAPRPHSAHSSCRASIAKLPGIAKRGRGRTGMGHWRPLRAASLGFFCENGSQMTKFQSTDTSGSDSGGQPQGNTRRAARDARTRAHRGRRATPNFALALIPDVSVL